MLLEELSDYLSSQGGFTDGTDLFRHGLQPAPARQVALNQSGGLRGQGNLGNDATAYVEQPTVQVLCRDNTATGAADLANDVFQLLIDVPARDLGGVRYYGIHAQQSPQFMQRDEQRREIFVFNVLIRKALS